MPRHQQKEYLFRKRVYVGGLPSNATSNELDATFNRFGKIRKIWVAQRRTGFAFIEFEEYYRDAEDVVKSMNGMRICGAQVRVEFAHTHHDRNGGLRRRDECDQIAKTDQSVSEMKCREKRTRPSLILFETLVEVICFFNISTLVKLTETCRRFINGSNYHPSVQNPHQMRSLRISYNHCGDYYWTFANNTYQLPSTPINNTAPPNFLSGLSQKIYVEITHMSWEYVQSVERFFTILQQSGLGAEEHTLEIDEQICCCDGGCYYRDGDCFGKISSLINAFSKFDTVKLNDIFQGSYITENSVLNSNRLYVSFQNDYDFVGPCIQWLNHKSPNSSLPQRELYVNAWCTFEDMRSLLLGLISNFCRAKKPFRFCLTFKTWCVKKEKVFTLLCKRAQLLYTNETEVRLENQRTGEALILTSMGEIDQDGNGSGRFRLHRACLVGPLEQSHFDKCLKDEKYIKFNNYCS